MKIRQLAFAFVAGGVTTALAATALSTQDQPSPEQMEKMMMEAMERYGTPGPEHAELAKNVGQWDVNIKMWPAPGAPPTEASGQANINMIMGGRFQFEQFTGDFMGMPFEGGGLAGYDRIKKKYVGMWIDNMSTSIMQTSAKMEDGHLVWRGKSPDVMSGTFIDMKMVEHAHSDDHKIVRFYMETPEGEFQSMELEYTRVKTN